MLKAVEDVMALVAGRECGTCTACCTWLPIRDPEIAKPANETCIHCVEGGGCRIYPRRPVVCHDWYCGWRTMPELQDAWRPDRSGLLFKPDEEDGYIVMLIGDPFAAFSQGFLDAVHHLIGRGLRVDLALPGPPGFFPGAVRLNDRLAAAIAADDPAQARAELARALESLSRHEWQADGIVAMWPS